MPTMNLTEKRISELKGTGYLVHYFDESLPGFGVYMKTIVKTYFVKGRIGTKQVMIAIGKTCEFKTVKQARQKAGEVLQMMRAGIDPREQKREAIRAATADLKKSLTLQEVLDEYLLNNKELKPSSANFYRLCVEVYLQDWKDKPIRSITDTDVKDRHKELSSKKKASSKNKDVRGGPGVADGTMKTLRLICNHAMKEYPGIIEANPVRLNKQWNKLKPRETFIKQDELPAWFSAVLALDNPTIRDMILLMLFTGLRSKSEAFGLTWGNIDFTSKTMRFYDTKNSSTLALPMSSYLYDMLKARYDECHDFEHVFPGDGMTGHIVDIRSGLKRIAAMSGLRITPHDLRRTFLTYSEYAGIPLYTRKAFVNHTGGRGDVTAGYTQIPIDQLRDMAEKVSAYILQHKEPRAAEPVVTDDYYI